MSMSLSLAPRSSTPNLLGYGRELVFDRHGHVAPGDTNVLEVTDIGLENLGWEIQEPRLLALAVAPLKGDPTKPWHLTPEEWGQVATEDCDGTIDEDFDADDTAGTPLLFTQAPRPEIEDRYLAMAKAAMVELQARERAKTEAARRGGIRPRLSLPTRNPRNQESRMQTARVAAPSTSNPAAANSAPAPRQALSLSKGSAHAPRAEPIQMASAKVLKARIETLKDEATRLQSPGATRLLGQALRLQACWNAEDQASLLADQAEQMLRRAATTPLLAECPAPAPSSPPRAATPMPMSSAQELMGRIQAARAAADQQKSHGAADLLRRALLVGQTQAEELVAEAERMLRACEQNPLREPIPATRRPATPPSIKRVGKTEAKRAKEQARRDEAARIAASNPPAPKAADPAPKAPQADPAPKGGKKGNNNNNNGGKKDKKGGKKGKK